MIPTVLRPTKFLFPDPQRICQELQSLLPNLSQLLGCPRDHLALLNPGHQAIRQRTHHVTNGCVAASWSDEFTSMLHRALAAAAQPRMHNTLTLREWPAEWKPRHSIARWIDSSVRSRVISNKPKNPDPSKVAILRTYTPLLWRFNPLHWRVQGFLGKGNKGLVWNLLLKIIMVTGKIPRFWVVVPTFLQPQPTAGVMKYVTNPTQCSVHPRRLTAGTFKSRIWKGK